MSGRTQTFQGPAEWTERKVDAHLDIPCVTPKLRGVTAVE
jgi:hypothetical protein